MLWYGTTSLSGSPYGSGRSSTPFTSAKIATAAPMPMIRVSDAVTVKAGLRRRDLQAGLRTDERDMCWRGSGRPSGLRAGPALGFRSSRGVAALPNGVVEPAEPARSARQPRRGVAREREPRSSQRCEPRTIMRRPAQSTVPRTRRDSGAPVTHPSPAYTTAK